MNKKRKDDAPCPHCNKIINFRTKEIWQHYKNCKEASKFMVKDIDYCECPICGLWGADIGPHIYQIHGLDKNQRIALFPDLLIRCQSTTMKTRKTNLDRYGSISPMGNKEVKSKAKQAFQDKYGVDNPFAAKEVQEKIKKTNQERYGVDHPMQNEDVFCKQQKSANQSPNLLEQFFDEHTCKNVVFTGYGGRYIRTKTGVHKYGRLIKDLCPDFMILSDNVLQSAISRSNDKKKLNNERHRSRYVIELLGDYYHSEKVIGVPEKEHEKEIIEAYASSNINCLAIWESDITTHWNETREGIGEWIQKAVEDMNDRPIYKKTTKHKIDKRKAHFICSLGSGEKFKTQEQLDKWIASDKNLYRSELVEEIDFVACQICSKRFKKLGAHVRRDHGISTDDYKIKYPGSFLLTTKEKERISKENKAKGSGRKYKQRVVYRIPDGSIVKKRDAWIRAWGVDSPPEDSILDASSINLDPWKDKADGVDYVTCNVCGYKGRNITRHVKKYHNIKSYAGSLKSEECMKALSAASIASWEAKKIHKF